MRKNDMFIDSFFFHFKKQDYIVLVILFDENEEKNEFALLKLHFFEKNNFDNNLLVQANSTGLIIDAKTLREYFRIEYSKNLRDILCQFNQHLSKFIPIKANINKTSEHKKLLLGSLAKINSDDPNRKFCIGVKRNPTTLNGSRGKRTPYNDTKTRELRSSLYEKLGHDKSLSFCYSVNKDEEKSDEDIIINWTKNKSLI